MSGLRPAEDCDAPGIRAVHEAAFPTRAEADLAEALGADGDAAVSLVADHIGGIVGHVLLSRMRVTADGRACRALGLGPIGVLPGYQGSGIGSQLIRGALAIAKATGEQFVFVLGEPDFYARFGFAAETAAPFASPYAGPYFLALALRDAAVPAAGTADYAPAFLRLAD